MVRHRSKVLSSSESTLVSRSKRAFSLRFGACLAALLLVGSAFSHAGNKEQRESPNALQVMVNAPMPDVVQAVLEVASDQIIYGTQSYQRERNLTGAHRAENSKAFREFSGPGTVFYKVMESALSPTNFKNSADMGTITVRFLVTPFDAKNTNLRIDAIFIENSSRKVHESDGSVEAAEFGEVRQHVEKIEAQHEIEKVEEARIAHEREEKQGELDLTARQDAARRAAADPAAMDLEQRVAQLRKKTEMRVGPSGTQLKSAPYKGAANLQTLTPYTEVVVLIVTQYWYGVQTEDGHRGWIHHSEVEALP